MIDEATTGNELFRLRRIRIRGFKALSDIDLKFHDDLLLLIGGNGAGKSSILQSLSFVSYFAKGIPSQFFSDRNWEPSELRTKIKTDLRPNIITYRIHLNDGAGRDIYWHFWWNLLHSRSDHEEIWYGDGTFPIRKVVFRRHSGPIQVWEHKEDVLGIQPIGSVVSILDGSAFNETVQVALNAIKTWAVGIFSLELLSPLEMRKGVRGNPTDIGPRGDRLGGFLASLSQDAKARLVKRLSNFYPIDGFETVRKKAGWVDLRISELYQGLGRVRAQHLSDGFLRMLGLASIPEFSSVASIVLLDEVEDGIEPHILSEFISLISSESHCQLVMTSHSPVLVNNFLPTQIAFCARSEEGRTYASSFADLEVLVQGLEYFGPGEIWANTNMNKINELVLNDNRFQDGSFIGPNQNFLEKNLIRNSSIGIKAFIEGKTFIEDKK